MNDLIDFIITVSILPLLLYFGNSIITKMSIDKKFNNFLKKNHKLKKFISDFFDYINKCIRYISQKKDISIFSTEASFDEAKTFKKYISNSRDYKKLCEYYENKFKQINSKDNNNNDLIKKLSDKVITKNEMIDKLQKLIERFKNNKYKGKDYEKIEELTDTIVKLKMKIDTISEEKMFCEKSMENIYDRVKKIMEQCVVKKRNMVLYDIKSENMRVLCDQINKMLDITYENCSKYSDSSVTSIVESSYDYESDKESDYSSCSSEETKIIKLVKIIKKVQSENMLLCNNRNKYVSCLNKLCNTIDIYCCDHLDILDVYEKKIIKEFSKFDNSHLDIDCDDIINIIIKIIKKKCQENDKDREIERLKLEIENKNQIIFNLQNKNNNSMNCFDKSDLVKCEMKLSDTIEKNKELIDTVVCLEKQIVEQDQVVKTFCLWKDSLADIILRSNTDCINQYLKANLNINSYVLSFNNSCCDDLCNKYCNSKLNLHEITSLLSYIIRECKNNPEDTTTCEPKNDVKVICEYVIEGINKVNKDIQKKISDCPELVDLLLCVDSINEDDQDVLCVVQLISEFRLLVGSLLNLYMDCKETILTTDINNTETTNEQPSTITSLTTSPNNVITTPSINKPPDEEEDIVNVVIVDTEISKVIISKLNTIFDTIEKYFCICIDRNSLIQPPDPNIIELTTNLKTICNYLELLTNTNFDIIQKFTSVNNDLCIVKTGLEKCKMEKDQIENILCENKGSVNDFISKINELEHSKSKLKLETKCLEMENAKCREQLVGKENFVRGLIAFLERFLENNYGNDNKVIETIICKLTENSANSENTMVELINVIKNSNEMTQEVLMNSINTNTNNVQANNELVLEIMNNNNPQNLSELITNITNTITNNLSNNNEITHDIVLKCMSENTNTNTNNNENINNLISNMICAINNSTEMTKESITNIVETIINSQDNQNQINSNIITNLSNNVGDITNNLISKSIQDNDVIIQMINTMENVANNNNDKLLCIIKEIIKEFNCKIHELTEKYDSVIDTIISKYCDCNNSCSLDNDKCNLSEISKDCEYYEELRNKIKQKIKSINEKLISNKCVSGKCEKYDKLDDSNCLNSELEEMKKKLTNNNLDKIKEEIKNCSSNILSCDYQLSDSCRGILNEPINSCDLKEEIKKREMYEAYDIYFKIYGKPKTLKDLANINKEKIALINNCLNEPNMTCYKCNNDIDSCICDSIENDNINDEFEI